MSRDGRVDVTVAGLITTNIHLAPPPSIVVLHPNHPALPAIRITTPPPTLHNARQIGHNRPSPDHKQLTVRTRPVHHEPALSLNVRMHLKEGPPNFQAHAPALSQDHSNTLS